MSCVNNNKKEWLKAEIDELIELYHAKPELWDIKSKIYKDRIKKQNALIQISEKFNTTVEEITRKIHNLRNQFNSELKKSTKKKSGEGTNELYISKWPYYNPLLFLQGGSLCRSAVGNIATDDAENIENEVQWETQDISFDQNDRERNIPIGCKDTTQKSDSRKRLKRNEGSQQNNLVEKALRALDEKEDAYDVFGKYVANEMRNLSSDYLRRKLKRKFQQIILEINDEEEELLSAPPSNAPGSTTNTYSNPNSVLNAYYSNPSSVASCSGLTSLSNQSAGLNQTDMGQSLASYLHNETESENYDNL